MTDDTRTDGKGPISISLVLGVIPIPLVFWTLFKLVTVITSILSSWSGMPSSRVSLPLRIVSKCDVSGSQGGETKLPEVFERLTPSKSFYLITFSSAACAKPPSITGLRNVY